MVVVHGPGPVQHYCQRWAQVQVRQGWMFSPKVKRNFSCSPWESGALSSSSLVVENF